MRRSLLLGVLVMAGAPEATGERALPQVTRFLDEQLDRQAALLAQDEGEEGGTLSLEVQASVGFDAGFAELTVAPVVELVWE